MDHGRDEKMTLVDHWVQLWGREEGEGRRGKGGGGREEGEGRRGEGMQTSPQVGQCKIGNLTCSSVPYT